MKSSLLSFPIGVWTSHIHAVVCLFAWLTIAVPADTLVDGVTEPYRNAVLSAGVNGRVMNVLVVEGAPVTEGQALVRLDDRQALLDMERRKLILESKAEITAARVQCETLKGDYESTRRLFEDSQSVSQEELNQKNMEYELARGKLASLETAEAREALEYRMAQQVVEEQTICSPMDGVVQEIFVEQGENCEPQQPLIQVVEVQRMRLVINVAASRLVGLEPGQVLSVVLYAPEGERTVEGTVEYLSPTVDAASGLRELKVLLSNTEPAIPPGVKGSLLLPES